ncbi:hypothetical protein E9531_03445 [Lampropedia puyangensis]|uniref:Uncharacterized protein n=1 Tax=Lampropedia puyangensis TaxID=1330072 RepID=A0A4S8FA37_9BURK|nr:hypothetical protein [Lampropedia puyangensis]THU04458.1 hypothetical protein E9531_03445 [Lampropedia puyangensis]
MINPTLNEIIGSAFLLHPQERKTNRNTSLNQALRTVAMQQKMPLKLNRKRKALRKLGLVDSM